MEFTDILLPLTKLLILVESFISWTMAMENFTLPSDCPKTCGDIKIEYPFGIGNGCFHADGFNLTCAYDSNASRLLLGDGTIQVMKFDMENNLVFIKSPLVTLIADAHFINTSLINLKNLPLSFRLRSVYSERSYDSIGYNQLFVVGCSATANIFDVVTNGTIGACSTRCSTTDTSTIEDRYNFSNGYCEIYLHNVNSIKKSWDIQLTRLNENENDNHMINNRTSIITAIIIDENFISYDDFQGFINHSNRTRMVASLTWYMSDHSTCKKATKGTNTYACRSHKSECYDVLSENASYLNETIGYNCQCSSDYIGNPYLSDGCQLDQNFTVAPMKDCLTECGNVTFFFPFGLKKGCYRDENFALTCNKTSHPPTLLFKDYYIVSKISLKEGQLEYNYPNISGYQSSTRSHFTFYESSYKETITAHWVVAYQSCNDAAKDMTTFACIHEHSSCLDVTDTRDDSLVIGYRCKCWDGYDGNPYLHDGCKDLNKCNSSNICTGTCINTDGNYSCICPLGTYGDPYGGACLPHKRNALLLGVILGASIGTGLLLFCIILVIVGKKWKQRNQKKIRQRNFHQNRGLLLQQLISTSDHVEERTNIFSLEEIEKATNNFDETRVLGHGGHGTVYKGILSDQRVVAIKKSKTVEKIEIDQFINEVAVLSQINHRNVVKLFGCCLETEVPLLIYEFISNGTLSDHLHVSEGESKLSWDDRLKIATESAGALAYLHSATSISIFHRDVKSTNILLDDTFKAKVSDFGASRFIPLNQTHIVTAIHGTYGYLDPEYYQTSQLTEKSDVYSFGIILLELLTGKMPVYSTNNGLEQNLAMNFLHARRENILFDLIEDQVLQEGTEIELLEISSLIEICLSLQGAKRPTMKEVEYKLQNIRKTKMKKKGVSIQEGNEETECLLTMSSHSSSGLMDQRNSRNYSFEKELMWSQNFPR